tara:strand:+ start:5179 stop:7998 length:2820 start_codon:yes stop_codon:yes gene_type:complete
MSMPPSKPFVLKKEEVLSKKRKASGDVSRDQDFDSRSYNHAKNITVEAIKMSIEAKPSDSRMVNLLYSFRAQADALGALGVFDDDTTELGEMLNEETGGHDALMKLIDAHIAMEREKEADNALLRPNMNAYMRTDALYPEALPYLPYTVFGDDEKLRTLESRRIGVEIEVRQALERVIDDAWNSEDAFERIGEVASYQADKLKAAELALMEGVVRAVDEQFKTTPLNNTAIGQWSLVTNDPAYVRIAAVHCKELASKRSRSEPSSPGSSSSTDAVSDVYGTLPPLPSVVTGTPFEDRQKKMAELKRLFRDSENRRVLAGGEFVNDTGGACAYVCSFAKYASMWTHDNQIQATLTAVPIALGIASVSGVATVTTPIYMTGFAICETLKGIHNRYHRGQSLWPPAIQRIKRALSVEDDSAKWLLPIMGTTILPIATHWFFSAKSEYMLLKALQGQMNNAGWGSRAVPLGDIVAKAREIRGAYRKIRDTPSSFLSGQLGYLGTLVKEFADSSFASELMGGEWVRDFIDILWQDLRVGVNLAGPVLLAMSTIYKAVSFVRDGYRPDRARLYLYCNDPENEVQKSMLENQELAREVLPILYGDGGDRYRGDKYATWEPLPHTTIKAWMPKLTDPTKPTQKMTSQWKKWFAEQVDWNDKSTDEIINAAKGVHLWKEPIVEMERILRQKFMLTDPMREGMKTLRDNWTEWSKTWKAIREYAHNNQGLRSVNWLAGETTANDLSGLWFKLYSVLKYQHAYIIGGINPSRIREVPEKKFDARATAANRPSFVTMIDEIQSLADASKNQSELPHNAERRNIKLDKFDDALTDKLETLFEKYYPGFADLAKKKATDKKKKKDEREAAAAVGQTPPQPPEPTPPLNAADIQWLLEQLNVPNPGQQPDTGDGPIDNLLGLGPLQAVPMGGVGVQASVVDEVYARVSALRLWG